MSHQAKTEKKNNSRLNAAPSYSWEMLIIVETLRETLERTLFLNSSSIRGPVREISNFRLNILNPNFSIPERMT